MAKLDEAAVRSVLASIKGPDGADLVSAGRIRSLVVNDGRVAFALAAGTQDGTAMEPVRKAAEAAVSALPGVTRVLGAVVADADAPGGAMRPPPAPAAAPAAPDTNDGGLIGRARRLAGRVTGASPAPQTGPPKGPTVKPVPRRTAPIASGQSEAQKGLPPEIKRVVAVGSGKGGVGKSTVSVNLAVALTMLGWRVGLLDADIYGPSVPTLLGQPHFKPKGEGGLSPLEAHGVKAMSIGFLVDPEKAVVWRGPMVTGALSQLMRETRWGPLDCLLIDMPPGTGDIQLSLAQQTALTGAVVVTTPQDLALLDVRKAAAMFQTVNVDILGVVENMSGFACPHCGEVSHVFGSGGGRKEAETRGVPFLGAVPLTLQIRESSDAGEPIALSPKGPEAEAYAAIASSLMAVLDTRVARPFPEIIFETG
ncbi:MAG: Mrp/NBP35 family ATP-binding protein [Pseudomonadota bacterium]